MAINVNKAKMSEVSTIPSPKARRTSSRIAQQSSALAPAAEKASGAATSSETTNLNIVNALGNVRWLAVFAATFASFVLGALWFTVFFGSLYKAALGRENEPDEPPAPIFIVGPLVCSFVTTVTSAILIQLLDVRGTKNALQLGALVGIGYHVAVMQNVAINPNFPSPFAYSAINAPYFLIGNIMSTLILVSMRK